MHLLNIRLCLTIKYRILLANYNPEEDEYANRQNGKSNGNILGYFQPGENSNGIQASLTNVISEQPSKRGYTNILRYYKLIEIINNNWRISQKNNKILFYITYLLAMLKSTKKTIEEKPKLTFLY